MGMVMKEVRGKASAEVVGEIIKRKLADMERQIRSK
jgi:Asp-tRNA(Asn)/Glu-tRNA(Gln) amidotransferase B subunit